MVADLVGAGGRDEGDQAAQKLVRLEHELCRAVAPAMAQVVKQPAIGQTFQAIGRHGRSRDIAAEAFEAAAIAGGDGDIGVQGEAHGGGAAGCSGCRHILGVDAVAAPGGASAAGGQSADRVGSETCELGLCGGERVGVGGVGFAAEAAALQKTRDPAGDALDDAPHLVILRRRQSPEAHARPAVAFVDAVEHERVEVHVEVQRVAEALDEGHGASPGPPDRAVLPGTAAVGGEHSTDELPQHHRCEGGIVGEAVAQGVGECQDPLADGHLGEHAVDEVGGGVGHAAAEAGGAEPASLAGEGDDLITSAVVAVDPKKPVGEDAALEEAAELALDESRQGAFADACQEALQFRLDDAIENGLLRAMALVCGYDRIVAGRRGEALRAL